MLRDALNAFANRAVWKPSWDILAVPDEACFGSAQSVFSLAPPEWRECRGYGSTDSAHVAAGRAESGPKHSRPEGLTEQETENAELRRLDYSHIPPLRIAERYAGGRRRRR